MEYDIADRVLDMIINHYNISDPRLMLPLVQIVAKVLPNLPICLTLISDVIDTSNWFMCGNLITYRIKLEVFRRILSHTMPKTYAVLVNIRALEEEYLNNIFLFYFLDIYSMHDVLLIVSLYIHLLCIHTCIIQYISRYYYHN